MGLHITHARNMSKMLCLTCPCVGGERKSGMLTSCKEPILSRAKRIKIGNAPPLGPIHPLRSPKMPSSAADEPTSTPAPMELLGLGLQT